KDGDTRARVGGKAHRHKVFQLGDPIREQEARYQNIRRWPIKLFVPHRLADWGDLESTSLYVVQERAKDAGRIKVWVTVPVDGTAKSRILACPRSVTKIFAGLISRWMMPLA